MRHYEHVYQGDEIIIVDPTSARAKYGTHYKEYMNPESRHWLREGVSTFPNHAVVFQLTEESGPSNEKDTGGFIVVMEQGYDGFYYEGAMHKSKIEWKKENDRTRNTP